ncbi:hypothetical protein J6590_079832 [Homalodisca vitripennis]|nr:hypothetical protein J6590_079832 [Homalodisca vitripennis]
MARVGEVRPAQSPSPKTRVEARHSHAPAELFFRSRTLSLYADDTIFLCRSFQQMRAADLMQQQMDLLSLWLKK